MLGIDGAVLGTEALLAPAPSELSIDLTSSPNIEPHVDGVTALKPQVTAIAPKRVIEKQHDLAPPAPLPNSACGQDSGGDDSPSNHPTSSPPEQLETDASAAHFPSPVGASSSAIPPNAPGDSLAAALYEEMNIK